MPSLLDDIITERLTLRLLGDEIRNACLAADLPKASELLGAVVTEAFLEHPSSLQHDQQQLALNAGYAPWSSRAIIHTNEKQAIGLIRFHAAPDPHALKEYMKNAVEVGYQIFEPHRRKGYAREAVTAAFDWAHHHFGVDRFIASVSPENLPSLNLIQSLGFVKVDEVMDEVDGMEYVFCAPIIKNKG
ncbi:GNAT family N-acetyltransferase [Chitinophaga varians]|uniref:GNAT family N-acetyltransferase n=1 Tax=Chitinophaga varians TaxID=2202339 RepID=UPI00165FFA77|nr:GNAT family N-acetyltransferase [Chitinophaga varians]MBC9914307.1 GNAT family N-acetyltransferase [Chitinophaga varians]